jgi:hypothetical protein
MDDMGFGAFSFETVTDFWDSYSRSNESNLLFVIFNSLYLDISGRLTGGSELMAVIGSNIIDPFSKIFMILQGGAGQFDSGMPELIKDIFDITLKNDGDTFSGKSIGFWGILYLSKSLPTIFIFTIMFVFLVTYLEFLCFKFGNRSFSLGVSFWLSYNVWESGFDLFVFMVPILICFLFFLNAKYLFNNILYK